MATNRRWVFEWPVAVVDLEGGVEKRGGREEDRLRVGDEGGVNEVGGPVGFSVHGPLDLAVVQIQETSHHVTYTNHLEKHNRHHL